MRPASTKSLQQLVEIARNPVASATILSSLNVGNDDKKKQSREKKSSDRSMTSREDYTNVDSVGELILQINRRCHYSNNVGSTHHFPVFHTHLLQLISNTKTTTVNLSHVTMLTNHPWNTT
ncbi:hypothetical protein PVL29_004962 [Vitis rotundifolia]|uniref:Uncharacterized protein n=1 Tax=Vitis rotundifolia TaxID=103349 RepID=A0AA39E0B0_VITRO|nr:hypothetical protein PVL29_004962 [Vitis rotundifolia]